VRLTSFDFQACSFNHSDISPFRINELQAAADDYLRDCDRSPNLSKSLTAISLSRTDTFRIPRDSLPNPTRTSPDR
jgi:hypothetical protein